MKLNLLFQNSYYNMDKEGIYVDVTTGEPLLALKINLIVVVVGQVLQKL